MTNDHILLEKNAEVAWITFNHPEKLNCLSHESLRTLITMLKDIRNDESVQAVIFTGSGSKAFSSGVNFREFIDLDTKNARVLISDLKETCELIRNIPQVVIMAINGICIGGAMEMSMAADLRVASSHAVFAMPEIKLGIPSVLDSVLLQQHVGLSLAKEMLLTGETFPAEKMNQFGFLNVIVDPSQVRETAKAYAEKITVHDPQTVAQQKTLFETWQNTTLDIAIQDSINQFSLSFATDVPQRKMKEFIDSKKK